MKRLLASSLVLCLAATSGLAAAETYRSDSDDGQDGNTRYDYARVLRVDPVFDSRNGSNYGTSNYRTSSSQRCYQRQTYVRGDGYNGGYDNGYYRTSDGSTNDGYHDDYRRDDGYNDQYGNYGRGGTQTGVNVATVIGGVVGAAIGSQVGGGSARYATAAIGSLVGGMAGRQIYEQNQRQRDRVGTVTVCDPVPVEDGYGNGYYTSDNAVNAYDVTYEYAGQQYTTRTSYHPGDRIRVRVDVRAE
ncbi:MAG TPA: glycine zipper 2TM domain-containing protein [Lysobacter sp.]|nr:glycine zipper 2TM domain-containing protein [Lysobacter sp.]